MTTEKRVLGIQLPTDPRWVNLAEMSIGDILTDHAYCEQKAASSCISIIINFPEYPEIVDQLSPIVTEEWGHFRMVIRELKKRGLVFGRARTDDYVNQLLKLNRKGVSRKDNLIDRLLICAMIEARSCERFRLLSLKISDQELRPFYYDLMVAEAAHYRLFLDLAATIIPEEQVTKRWKEVLAAEAEIVSKLEVRGDRMH
jgi:tRNA-(ms[2]io[6]A)-hydroxylase